MRRLVLTQLKGKFILTSLHSKSENCFHVKEIKNNVSEW